MKLSIVIVNYNVKYYLEQCLRSVESAAVNIAHEVIVVDNASEDGSLAYLEPRFPNVIWIESKVNGGFSHANNIGFGRASGEYILMLNPDTIVTREALEGCVAFMDEHPEAGAAGVKMISKDGVFAPESRRALPTPFVAFCKMSGLAALFPKSRIFGRYYMRYLDENEVNPIEIISGAFMFLRREALDKAGLLDEVFFMYGEDIDLSYRILKAGYKNYFLPLCILHYKGESTVKSSYRYVYTFYQAMQLFFNKHYAHYSIVLSVPIKLAIWTRAILAYAGNQFKHRNEKSQALQPINCIVMGDIRATEEVRMLLAEYYGDCRHVFITANEQSHPQGHLTQGINHDGYDTVIYDTDAYSYDTILRLLSQKGCKRLYLGTYSTKSGMLITEGVVHCYKNE